MIFQRYIPCRHEGFAQSADTITGRRECVLIEMVKAERATYRVDRIRDTRICLLGLPEALDQRLAGKILAALSRVEDIFHQAMEIEWGFDGEKLWLFQARPLLTLPPLETWWLPPESGPGKVLTPFSAELLRAGDESGGEGAPLESLFARLGLLPPGDLCKDFEGRTYVSWSRLESARRRVRTGRLPLSAYARLALLILKKKADDPGPLADESSPYTLSGLARALAAEIRRQQEDIFLADALAQLALALAGGRITGEEMRGLFRRHEPGPWLKIAGELDRRLAKEDAETVAKDYPYLSRDTYELARPRAAENPGILQDFRLVEDAEALSAKPGAKHIPYTQPDAAIPWIPFVLRFFGGRACALRISAEERHLRILKINHALRTRAVAQAAEMGLGEDEVFFHTRAELEGRRALPAKEKIAKRKTRYERQRSRPFPGIIHTRQGRRVIFSEPSGDGKEGWPGVGFGAGSLSGRLTLSYPARSEGTDDILLLPDTETRHIGRLAPRRPVLAESGGILSHLANVARQIDAPLFVMNDGGGKLRAGDRVEIDFSGGVVRRV